MIRLCIGLNFISFVYQRMSNYIYLQMYMIYKMGFRRKLVTVDLFESVSQTLHCLLFKKRFIKLLFSTECISSSLL